MTQPVSRRALASQIAIVTTLVAVVVVAVSFLVSAGLIRSTAETQARHTLGHYADLVAENAVAGKGLRADGNALGIRALARLATITAFAVGPRGRVSGNPPGPLPQRLIDAAAAGEPYDGSVTISGHAYFAEARPLDSGVGSVVLLQPHTAASEITSPLRDRLLIALAAGLVVAVAAGAWLSRRLARPLVHAAEAAGRLAHGQRDVRVTPEGPAEVAAVSDSINALATSLATSEDRQRSFLLSVSHELRTPLTAIAGYAEALADGVVEPADSGQVGATMQAEATRLQRLVDDLLDLARLGSDDFRVQTSTVDLNELITAAAAVWTDRCGRDGVELRTELPAEPVIVLTDAGRVRQIVDGLAENALRVTPAGKPIVLAAREVPGGAQVEVRDGGPGLSDDDMRVAFERSALYDRYRGQRRVGTGIGLALIAGLAERLGGRAEAGHAPEGGARFTVSLRSLT
ncbi:MAG TPA: HAMP domain-containing sensor histidine kinase [Mycobacteriales bacterium]|nr:HAMP domain-containing sensor histidine kinase [Mycobacteriales bacterium]